MTRIRAHWKRVIGERKKATALAMRTMTIPDPDGIPDIAEKTKAAEGHIATGMRDATERDRGRRDIIGITDIDIGLDLHSAKARTTSDTPALTTNQEPVELTGIEATMTHQGMRYPSEGGTTGYHPRRRQTLILWKI